MKHFSVLILLVLGLGMQSCDNKDTVDIFEPSLSLDEYVLLNINGIERLYHADEDLGTGIFTRFDAGIYTYNDINEFYLLFNGEGPYSGFGLRTNEPEVGAYTLDGLTFYFGDYSLTDEIEYMNISCVDYANPEDECKGEVNVVIHSFGAVGEKVMGEISGSVLKGDGSGESNNFTGEFVVRLDD